MINPLLCSAFVPPELNAQAGEQWRSSPAFLLLQLLLLLLLSLPDSSQVSLAGEINCSNLSEVRACASCIAAAQLACARPTCERTAIRRVSVSAIVTTNWPANFN